MCVDGNSGIIEFRPVNFARVVYLIRALSCVPYCLRSANAVLRGISSRAIKGSKMRSLECDAKNAARALRSSNCLTHSDAREDDKRLQTSLQTKLLSEAFLLVYLDEFRFLHQNILQSFQPCHETFLTL